MEERFLATESGEGSDEGWASEALAVIADVVPYVQEMSIAASLPVTSQGIYMNLITKEGAKYTVEMTSAGFRICGRELDTLDAAARHSSGTATGEEQESQKEDDDNSGQVPAIEEYYETPYSLLDAISPAYRKSFSDALTDRLNALPPPSPSK